MLCVCLFVQFNVRCNDLGDPLRNASNTATVTVNVERNTVCPTFTNLDAVKDINENDSGLIFTVIAIDNDNDVSFFLYIIFSI